MRLKIDGPIRGWTDTDRYTCRQTQTGIQTDIQTVRDRQTDGQTDRQIDRDEQTNKLIFLCRCNGKTEKIIQICV